MTINRVNRTSNTDSTFMAGAKGGIAGGIAAGAAAAGSRFFINKTLNNADAFVSAAKEAGASIPEAGLKEHASKFMSRLSETADKQFLKYGAAAAAAGIAAGALIGIARNKDKKEIEALDTYNYALENEFVKQMNKKHKAELLIGSLVRNCPGVKDAIKSMKNNSVNKAEQAG